MGRRAVCLLSSREHRTSTIKYQVRPANVHTSSDHLSPRSATNTTPHLVQYSFSSCWPVYTFGSHLDDTPCP